MKQYYLILDGEQKGPMSYDELSALSLKKTTPVWYSGLEDWSTIEKVEELKKLIIVENIPPKFIDPNINPKPPQLQKSEEKKIEHNIEQKTNTAQTIQNSEIKKKSYLKPILFVLGIIALIIIISLIINSAQGSNYNENYQQNGVEEYAPAINSVDEAELERKRINEELTRKNMNYRNNFTSYLTISTNNYNYREIGGIFNLTITFNNNTDYVINAASVRVGYVQANGSYYKTEVVNFENIQPFSQQTTYAPDSERGLRVELDYDQIYSKKMHFLYPSNNGNPEDPYFYK